MHDAIEPNVHILCFCQQSELKIIGRNHVPKMNSIAMAYVLLACKMRCGGEMEF